jgi:Leucine-rich repeat (LRR) protein
LCNAKFICFTLFLGPYQTSTHTLNYTIQVPAEENKSNGTSRVIKGKRRLSKPTSAEPPWNDLEDSFIQTVQQGTRDPSSCFSTAKTYGRHISLNRRRLSHIDLNALSSPISLHQFQSIRSLDLSRNKLINLPATLTELIYLSSLNVAYNKLAAVPSFLPAFEYLEVLILSNNEINQTVPSFLGYLTQLKVLQLDGNEFYGKLPSSMAALKLLRNFTLGSSTFGGNAISEIPLGIFGNWNCLEEMDLSHNHLTELPEDAFSSQQLCTLTLEGNRLETLPDTIHRASQLTTLMAANNILCRLPISIAICPKLSVLDLSGNSLCFVPMELIRIIHQRHVTVLLTGNPFTRLQEDTFTVLSAISNMSILANSTCKDLNMVSHTGLATLGIMFHQGTQRERSSTDQICFEKNPSSDPNQKGLMERSSSLESISKYLHPTAVYFDVQQLHLLPEASEKAISEEFPTVVSLKELAARACARQYGGQMDLLKHFLTPSLFSVLANVASVQCQICATPIICEYLNTVEIQRVLGHAAVPVHKKFCSKNCLFHRQ